jgi:hypothetical protein
MNLPESLSAGGARTSADQRVAPRFALLLRVGKLIADGGGEYVCLVRDVSETGVRLRLFHSLAGLRDLALESASGAQIGVEMVWEHGSDAGFRFARPIDVARFIAEAGPYPKRPIRIAVDHAARIAFAGVVARARLRNLSRQGAAIETEQHLAIGQRLRLAAADLQVEATVCWRREPTYGLVFSQIMSLEDLALRSLRMQG